MYKEAMFSRISTILLFVFVTFTAFASAWTTVTVTPTPTPSPLPASQCNTGPIQCCSSVQAPSSSQAVALLSILGIVIEGVTALVGITCSPIASIGGTCSATPVCCENNQNANLIAIGCVPVIL